MKKIYAAAFAMALVVAIAVWLFASNIMKENTRGKEEVPTKAVVTAVNDIEDGITISAEMLRVVELPETAALNGSYQEIEDLVGKVTVEKIYAQEQVTNNKVREMDDLVPTHLSYTLEEGYRAVTIAVNKVSGVANYIKKGDKVDIICHNLTLNMLEQLDEQFQIGNQAGAGLGSGTETAGELDKATFSKILFQNCQVLAVGTYDENLQEGGVTAYDTITLALPVEDAVTLSEYAQAKTDGNLFSLLLRNRDDESIIKPEDEKVLMIFDIDNIG